MEARQALRCAFPPPAIRKMAGKELFMSWNPDPPSTSPPDYDTDLPIYQNVGDFVSWGYQYINYLGAQAFNTASTALNALAAMDFPEPPVVERSEEHTSELQSLMRI